MMSALLAGLVIAQPAAALTFSFSMVTGDTLTPAQRAAFQTAADAWSSALTDPVTVSLQIGFRQLGTNILGQTSPNLVTLDANIARLLLTQDAKSAIDAQAVASLPVYAAGTQLLLTSAQARAIGASAAAAVDAIIEFSTAFSFSTSRDAGGQIAAGTHDLVGIAEHEIGHALGFVSDVDYDTGTQTVLDQFRYSAPQTRSQTPGAAAYFSVDGGTTDIAAFSAGGSGNYQASHWANGSGYLMQPALAQGVVQNITPTDLTGFDAIGYDLAGPGPATPVTEPAGVLVLGIGLLGLGLVRRRRPAQPGPSPVATPAR